MEETSFKKLIGISLLCVCFVIIFSVIVVGIINIQENTDPELIPEEDLIVGTGEITYLSFEGGFYGIITDDGNHYDPHNLPSEFKIDGLKVNFTAKLERNMLCYHMWGRIVSIIAIQRL